MGALRPGGKHPGTADLPRGRGRPAVAPSISYDGLVALRRRCAAAEREAAALRKVNARLRQAAEADRKRAEIAEACAKRIFALVAQR